MQLKGQILEKLYPGLIPPKVPLLLSSCSKRLPKRTCTTDITLPSSAELGAEEVCSTPGYSEYPVPEVRREMGGRGVKGRKMGISCPYNK